MTTNPTSSAHTRVFGLISLFGFALVTLLGLFLTDPDDKQGDLVRIIYVHVPSAIMAYAGFVVGAIASGFFLKNRNAFADLVAHSAIEVGVVFGVLTLITGAVWGSPSWGTYWEWGDVRLVSMLVLVLLYVGYLALRQIPGDVDSTATRSAMLALMSVVMIPIVRYSVNWWKNDTLHQQASLTDGKLEDLTLFTLVLSIVVFGFFFVWLTTHRFRVAWLERQVDEVGLADAITERRAEAAEGVQAAIANPGGES